MNIIEFEQTLAKMRLDLYHNPPVDIINDGFRPVSGKVADFAVAELDGKYHFYYIERRLTEGTPFYPGNEIYFGHASTDDFINWNVHDPVMLIRPGTWESAHVWAPCIIKRGDTYVMAYTGVNGYISQDIGLAFSKDLFIWERWESNPLSPCKDRPWARWHENEISSCRDPSIFEHDGRVWMIYTANSADGASCIALTSSADLENWEDHGIILKGYTEGYEPKLQGGHRQGSLESANMLMRNGRWYLLVKTKLRDSDVRNWIYEADSITGPFNLNEGREFWSGALGLRVIKDRGCKSMLGCFTGGTIKFGEVNWSEDKPKARFFDSVDELRQW